MKNIKKILLMIIITLPALSCYDGLNDMLGNLDIKVPICVNSATGNDLDDGRGWKNAKASIQAAIDAADAGDEIWVAGDHIITTTVEVNKSVSIYGGFNGTESRFEERKQDKKTIIEIDFSPGIRIDSVNILFDCMQFINNTSISIRVENTGSVILENCYFGNEANNTPGPAINNAGTTTIKKSIFNKLVRPSGSGAAILSTSGSIIIFDTTFSSNATNYNSGGAICTTGGSNLSITKSHFITNSTVLNGGAIFSSGISSGEITISDTEFIGNKALADEVNTYNATGGACYFYNISKLVISRCTFGDLGDVNKINIASGSGLANAGAVYIENVNDSRILDSFFYSNTSADAGGGIYSSNSVVTVNGCEFISNGSSGSGGAVYINNGTFEISDTLFKLDHAVGCGGAICLDGSSSITIDRCRLDNNTASQHGGGIYLQSTSPCSIINTLFYNNIVTGGNGGALYVNGSTDHKFINLTFYLNSESGSGSGGAIYFNCTSSIYNSAFYLNTDDNPSTVTDNINSGAAVELWLYNSFYYEGVSALQVHSSACLTDDPGNPFKSIDPIGVMFLKPEDVIIDQGLDTAPGLAKPSTDLAGKNRFVDISGIANYSTNIIDIGCYERQ